MKIGWNRRDFVSMLLFNSWSGSDRRTAVEVVVAPIEEGAFANAAVMLGDGCTQLSIYLSSGRQWLSARAAGLETCVAVQP